MDLRLPLIFTNIRFLKRTESLQNDTSNNAYSPMILLLKNTTPYLFVFISYSTFHVPKILFNSLTLSID